MFFKNKSKKDGYSIYCKDCFKIISKKSIEKNKIEIAKRRKIYRINNKDKIRKYRKQYYLDNKDKENKKSREYKQSNKNKIKKYNINYREKNKNKIKLKKEEYRIKNKEYMKNIKRIYGNKKYREDISYKFTVNIRNKLRKYLKNHNKSKDTQEILGYSFKDFEKFIIKNNRIPKEYEFKDYLKGTLSLDHIIPLDLFPKDENGFRLANKLENFRLIPLKDNMIKGNSIDMDLIKEYNLINLFNEVKAITNG